MKVIKIILSVVVIAFSILGIIPRLSLILLIIVWMDKLINNCG